MSKCRYCQKEITWMKEGRKNVPVESDGTVHHCEVRKASLDSLVKKDRSSLSEEEIKKYEQAINQKK